MFTTAQCQKPRTVGASGSTMVTTKLFVPDGKPLHESCGETSWPPAPMMPLTCGIASFSPSRRSLLVSEKETAGGRLSYGFQLIFGLFLSRSGGLIEDLTRPVASQLGPLPLPVWHHPTAGSYAWGRRL